MFTRRRGDAEESRTMELDEITDTIYGADTFKELQRVVNQLPPSASPRLRVNQSN